MAARMAARAPSRCIGAHAQPKLSGKRVSFAKLDENELDSAPMPDFESGPGNDAIETEEARTANVMQRMIHHAATGVLIVLWYAASIVCNQTSKELVGEGGVLTSATLTLAQCSVSVGCGLLVMLASGAASRCSCLRDYAFHSRKQLLDTTLLAVAFTAGFFTLNASIAAMHISLVMVLRGAEPLTTLMLARLLLPSSAWPTRAKLVAIVPVVVGCALSAVGPHGPTPLGLCLVLASNACFSLRAIFGKQITASHGTTALPLFLQLCVLSVLLQTVLLALSTRLAPAADELPSSSRDELRDQLSTILINGASFYAYLQLSFVVLGRMSAVSHSVTNSMRRPATIAAALLYQPVDLTLLNYSGLCIACAGSLVYGVVR